eukprot:g4666.t1
MESMEPASPPSTAAVATDDNASLYFTGLVGVVLLLLFYVLRKASSSSSSYRSRNRKSSSSRYAFSPSASPKRHPNGSGASRNNNASSYFPESPPLRGALPYGVYAIKGHRPYMEDRYAVSVSPHNKSTAYGVFDGHGGSRASEYCAENLLKLLTSDPSYDDDPKRALTNAFLETDRSFLEIARSAFYDDGSTAIVALFRGPRDLYVANVGDSRAVLVRRDGSVLEMSKDHKPNDRDEQRRIERAGGIVVHVGVWRVEGVLAVSRAVGDRAFKDYVVADPDVREHARECGRDDFLVLATDGLWDVVSNEKVASIVRACASATEAAKVLTETAFALGSRDNICSLVVDLRGREGEADKTGVDQKKGSSSSSSSTSNGNPPRSPPARRRRRSRSGKRSGDADGGGGR